MGAPTALDEKSVNIPETVTALHQLEKALTSEVCDHEGRSGNELVYVTCKTLFMGKKVWVADEAGVRNIDVGPMANLPLMSDSNWNPSITDTIGDHPSFCPSSLI